MKKGQGRYAGLAPFFAEDTVRGADRTLCPDTHRTGDLVERIGQLTPSQKTGALLGAFSTPGIPWRSKYS